MTWEWSDLLLMLAGFYGLCILASFVFVLFRLWASR